MKRIDFLKSLLIAPFAKEVIGKAVMSQSSTPSIFPIEGLKTQLNHLRVHPEIANGFDPNIGIVEFIEHYTLGRKADGTTYSIVLREQDKIFLQQYEQDNKVRRIVQSDSKGHRS